MGPGQSYKMNGRGTSAESAFSRADVGRLLLLWVFSLAIMGPALASGSGWGLYDWDLHMCYFEAPRRTLLEFGQFPWWNPWYCGGIPLFGNPQCPFLSLTFVLTLPFGVPFGIKVSAVLHAFIGMAGGYALARLNGIDRTSAMLGGLVLMGSSVYTLHVAVGHTNWLAIAYLPWTLWFLCTQSLRLALGALYRTMSGSHGFARPPIFGLLFSSGPVGLVHAGYIDQARCWAASGGLS